MKVDFLSWSCSIVSHDVAGPVTVHGQEVSGYTTKDQRVEPGKPGHMARQDLWVIKVSQPVVFCMPHRELMSI